MTTPLDEFLSEFGPVEKTAGQTSFPFAGGGRAAEMGKKFTDSMISGAGAAATTAVIGGVAIGAKALMAAATKSRDFKLMLEHNQDLKDHFQSDPKRFNQMYSSLHTMNPAFAKDPLVAGTFMRQMAENPLNAGGILTQAVGSRDAFPSMVDRSRDEAIGASKSHFSRKPNQAPQ